MSFALKSAHIDSTIPVFLSFITHVVLPVSPGRAPALITVLSSSTTMSSSPPPILPMASTPNISNHDLHSSLFPLSSSALDVASVQSPSRSDSERLVDSDSTGSANTIALPDVDPQIVEALKSKDRIYVLKLGEQMESLINDRRFVFSPFPCSFARQLRLLHRETSLLAFSLSILHRR